MTAPYADLIERLRAVGSGSRPAIFEMCWPRNPDGPEAAKAIEALQADYDSMVENENRTARELAQADARVEALQAEVNLLRVAISWLDDPFIDATTPRNELDARIKFMLADAARADLTTKGEADE